MKDLIGRVSGPAIVLGTAAILWFALTPRFIPELFFPSPKSVWIAVTSSGWRLLGHSGVTLLRVVIGCSLGCLGGIAIGVSITWSRAAYHLANPVIEILRPLPPIALIPFFILWFGIGWTGQILLIALGCLMVMAVSTHVAITNVKPAYILAAASLGASKGRVYRTVVLPAILPSLLSGVRVATALAFGVAVAAEFMGAQSGIGFLIMVARRTLNTNMILLGTIILGLQSYALDALIRRTASSILQWVDRPSDALVLLRFNDRELFQ